MVGMETISFSSLELGKHRRERRAISTLRKVIPLFLALVPSWKTPSGSLDPNRKAKDFLMSKDKEKQRRLARLIPEFSLGQSAEF
jgi:hypothetical protein